ncbi:MAG: response regulator transcription factor [Lachnospiraceae bacterium]|nr:response regulator transcription factor [Lachnospiraceae bacterium]
MKIAIVDDEKIIREEIENLIRERKPDCYIESFESGDALLLAEKQYDIVFLDIQLEGRNGIDTARILRQKSESTVLIFVTGAKDYVFQAFDVAAFHYLLKPLERTKFEEVLDRALREAEKKKKTETELLLIKTRNRTIPMPKSNILYVESRGKKAEVHTAKETLEMYASLNGLESDLGAGFYRCHRGYLVNMAHVSEYYHDSILLTSGETIYLAKEKYPEFVKEYMHYLKNGGTSYG